MLIAQLDFNQDTSALVFFKLEVAGTSLVILFFCSTRFVEQLLIAISQALPAVSG